MGSNCDYDDNYQPSSSRCDYGILTFCRSFINNLIVLQALDGLQLNVNATTTTMVSFVEQCGGNLHGFCRFRTTTCKSKIANHINSPHIPLMKLRGIQNPPKYLSLLSDET